ncbi:GRAM domain-containing protein [Algoriphagus sp. AGSA1]|uniref:GRAM domain-containing protein n=1 Tax=Algoriphagus sp. AGSA1 TaxID=2907213 RepID=UPI001F1901D4|nr:GRAM domain-containing protein [Algoriphagus sp. AGSA1]MCE7053521.1 GRAM domain-containing protein [Algoriphagus sp. AGSA1]
MLICTSEFYDWKSLLFQGFFFGLFMALVYPLIFRKMAEKAGKIISPDLEPGEIIETEESANLFRGAEAVGGKLFLTNERVIFKSHKFNINTGQSDISYNLISEVSPRKTGMLVGNGLRLTLVDGREYDFVISNRETWMEKFQEKLAR